MVLNKTDAALVHATANIPLHPSFFYEIAFHTVSFVLLWRVVKVLRPPAINATHPTNPVFAEAA